MATKVNTTFSKGGEKVTKKTVEAKEPSAPIPAQPIVRATTTTTTPTPEQPKAEKPVTPNKTVEATDANTVRSATFENGEMKLNYGK